MNWDRIWSERLFNIGHFCDFSMRLSVRAAWRFLHRFDDLKFRIQLDNSLLPFSLSKLTTKLVIVIICMLLVPEMWNSMRSWKSLRNPVPFRGEFDLGWYTTIISGFTKADFTTDVRGQITWYIPMQLNYSLRTQTADQNYSSPWMRTSNLPLVSFVWEYSTN